VNKEMPETPPNGGPGFFETPNFLKILAQSPAASRAYHRTERALAQGRLSKPNRERIALAVAEINGAEHCLQAHAEMGRLAGLTGEEIESARRAAAAEPRADQMLRFTQSVVLQRGEISDADLGALRRAGFSEAEVIEIIANIALNIFTNYLNILSKTEPCFPAAPPVLRPGNHTSANALSAPSPSLR
jgi:uncharacterized peroxidase-related enzyme